MQPTQPNRTAGIAILCLRLRPRILITPAIITTITRALDTPPLRPCQGLKLPPQILEICLLPLLILILILTPSCSSSSSPHSFSQSFRVAPCNGLKLPPSVSHPCPLAAHTILLFSAAAGVQKFDQKALQGLYDEAEYLNAISNFEASKIPLCPGQHTNFCNSMHFIRAVVVYCRHIRAFATGSLN